MKNFIQENTAIMDMDVEIQISHENGFTDSVDICRDIMIRNADKFDYSINGSLFYYTPLAVQELINKSYKED